MKKKVLGITLILVMLISFMGCDGLTNISGSDDEDLLGVVMAGLLVARASIPFHTHDSIKDSGMITINNNDNSEEIIWNNFDFQKAMKETGLNSGELPASNVIIESGRAKQDDIEKTMEFDFKYRYNEGNKSFAFRVYVFIDDEGIILRVNNHTIDTSGVTKGDLGL